MLTTWGQLSPPIPETMASHLLVFYLLEGHGLKVFGVSHNGDYKSNRSILFSELMK